MTVSREDVVAAARRAFPSRDASTVLRILDEYAASQPERERVQIAILKLSNGQDDRLRHFVDAAKQDYRDVLFWAQNPAEPPPDSPLLDVVRTKWAWAVSAPTRVIAQNHFGNLLVEVAAGGVWRICPEDLSAEKVADSASAVAALMADEEFDTDWSVAAWVDAAESSLGPLEDGQCYGFKIWPVLGGEYATDNMVVKSLLEWLAVSGDVGRQASR